MIAVESSPKAGIVEPLKPLTPAQADSEADRRAGIQKRIRDQQADAARKIADLRARLATGG